MTARPEPVLRILPDAAAVAAAAAAELAALAARAVAERGRVVLALAGGSTPGALYRRLAEPPCRDALPWHRVELFWGDERMVPPGHPDSNYGMARAVLLEAVPVDPGRVHRIRGEDPPEQAAEDYERELARVLGGAPGGPPPAFDLVLLGMGADGHTASLFPGSPALTERRRWVVAPPAAGPGPRRVSLGPRVLNRARELWVLVTGRDKAATLAAALEGPRDPERLPVQLLAPDAGRLVWLVDRAAAACLARSRRTPA